MRPGSLWRVAPLVTIVGAATAAVFGFAAPVEAQREMALKGAVTFSRFHAGGTETTQFDDRLVATGFGGHVRFGLGPLYLQPELFLVTRGATASVSEFEEEQLRLEYIEIPLLLAAPVRVGSFEPYIFGGPLIALESRCRYVTREQGLRTNVGCDGPGSSVFDRRAFDYGLTAGGGISHPLASGRILVEARQTWGMRNIVNPPPDADLQNRTFMLLLGYAIPLDANGR